MASWSWPAYIGILFGVLTFALLLVPILAFEYRRYGQFTPRRAAGAAALSVYATSLVAYTLLPLPASRGDWCASSPAGSQWRPFHFVADISDAAAAVGPFEVLSSRVTLQVLFNVILFVPWGLMVRGFVGRSTAAAVGTGFLASLAVESTQLTGNWGIYECAYRVGDVDDLLANTLGAALGAALAGWVLWWMPRPQSFATTRLAPRPVTNARRWLGMALDLVAFNALAFALVIGFRLTVLASTGQVPTRHTLVETLLGTLVPAVWVFVLPAWRGTGASLGQRAVRLVPVWKHPSRLRRVLRATSVAGSYAAALLLARWQDGTAWGEAAELVSYALLVAAFVAVPLTGRRGLSGVLTGARFRDDRERPGSTTDG